MTKDILLAEQGNGGEMAVLGNDLVLTEELLQMAYLALFGGNIEASTTGQELESELRYDWWANGLLYAQAPQKQFNSETERVLQNTVLNSSGRLEIKSAIENDLAFLGNVANVGVEVNIETHDRVEMYIKLTSLANQEEKVLQLLFDNAKNEVIIRKEI